MKIIEHTLRHGEVYFDLVDELPANDLPSAELDNNRSIVGHSESGHHHVLDGNAVRVVDYDEFVSFAEVKEKCKVIHLKTTHDRHDDAVLLPGKYLITRQREYTPKGYRRAAD
jgi:hypothetical protein